MPLNKETKPNLLKNIDNLFAHSYMFSSIPTEY